MDLSGGFFTADFRDGQVYSAGKKYPAGHFAVTFMNQFYENETAGRIVIFSYEGQDILDQLRDGFLKISQYVRVGEKLHWAIKALPRLTPFDQIDQEALHAEVTDLFSEECCRDIYDYFRYRGAIANIDENEACIGFVDRIINRDYMRNLERQIARIQEILRFFLNLSEDLKKLHEALCLFVEWIDTAERFDEAHLLPIALEFFGTPPLPYSTQYIAAPKTSRSKSVSVTRRLTFDRFASFIYTDFFEGLHYGHYLRQCPICEKYFLMQSARRQVYCPTGYAPELYRGQRLTCRKYAAVLRRKELAENDPVLDLYNRRAAAIRTEKNRGTIDPDFAKAAMALARNRKLRAMDEENYAATEYEKDLSREKLYADVRAGVRL